MQSYLIFRLWVINNKMQMHQNHFYSLTDKIIRHLYFSQAISLMADAFALVGVALAFYLNNSTAA